MKKPVLVLTRVQAAALDALSALHPEVDRMELLELICSHLEARSGRR